MASNNCECDFIGEPSDKLKCLICLDVAKEPKQHDKCGKIFCGECVKRIKDKPCPTCKTQKPNYFTDTRAAQEIRDLSVKCKNSRGGCPWEGTVGTLPDHVTSCEYEVVLCKYSYIGCDVKNTKKDMEKHEEEDDKHHLHLALQSVAIPTLSYGEKIVFKITDYSVKKRNNEVFTSDPFYTHINGYKMCVKVYLNGTGSGAGTHVSVSTCLLQGPFDKQLKWPFTWTLKVDLIDQLKGCNNLLGRFTRNDHHSDKHCCQEEFVSNTFLSQDNTLLMNNSLYFRVSVSTENKDDFPWLECGKRTHDELLLACRRFANKEPLVFKIADYEHLKLMDSYYRYSFCSGPSGYSMDITVYCNGEGRETGTHLSVFVSFNNGPYNKLLPWPFIGRVQIELLNQTADRNHLIHTLEITENDNVNAGNSIGYPEFIRQNQLQCGYLQFLVDGCLYFRVFVSVGANYKPWLLCTD